MKLLVIRFSSFGDIVQSVAVPRAFLDAYPGSASEPTTVDWLTREDFAGLLKQQPTIANVIAFPRSAGLSGLLRLAKDLSRSNYTHVYDAHSNLRSSIMMSVLRMMTFVRELKSWVNGQPRGQTVQFATRPKDRLRRFLFFKFRLNTLPRPFRGADSYHRPLQAWGLPAHVPEGVQFHLKSEDLPDAVESDLVKLRSRSTHLVAVAASAAWEMKRWPVAHWQTLIRLLPEAGFLLFGGPEDQFLEEIKTVASDRIVNLAGRLTLDQSSAALLRTDLVISNDTGLLHVADQMNRPTIALIGPTAFGYPSHSTSITLERPLSCQPCSKDGRGRCTNSLYQRCLVELTPEMVAAQAMKVLVATPPEAKP